MPAAKKCRFCGESLENKEKRKLPISRLYFLWLSSLLAFFVTLFIVRRTPDNFSNSALIAFTGIVIFGGVAYLAMMVDILREISSTNAKKFGLISLVTFVAFFWLLINIETVEARLGFSPMPQNQPTPNRQIPTSNSPKAAPTLSPSKQTPKVNNDAQPIKAEVETQNTRKRVQYTVNQRQFSGTYSCYEDKVNSLSKMEVEIRTLESVADGCQSRREMSAQSCVSYECSNMPNWTPESYKSCSDRCWSNAGNCDDKHQEVGNKLSEYARMLDESCP